MTNFTQMQDKIFIPTQKTIDNYFARLRIERYREIATKIDQEEILSFEDQCILFLILLAQPNMVVNRARVQSFAYNDDDGYFWQITDVIENIANNMLSSNDFMGCIANLPIKPRLSKQIQTYIIRNKQTGQIKIGKSTNPQKRIQALQSLVGSELEILCIFNRDIELKLHHYFDDFRAIGEWFNDRNGEIQKLVDEFTHKGEAWVVEQLISEGVIA